MMDEKEQFWFGCTICGVQTALTVTRDGRIGEYHTHSHPNNSMNNLICSGCATRIKEFEEQSQEELGQKVITFYAKKGER